MALNIENFYKTFINGTALRVYNKIDQTVLQFVIINQYCVFSGVIYLASHLPS